MPGNVERRMLAHSNGESGTSERSLLEGRSASVGSGLLREQSPWSAYAIFAEYPPAIVAEPTLPLVSVVTPSFNQAQFIRETIESVLGQDYPNIEYWVIDGGSADGTQAILAEYERDPRFHWLSEPDRGQADAINKGWARCRGEILCWLNSDDCYIDGGAVRTQVEALQRNPHIGLVYGDGLFVDVEGKGIEVFQTRPYSYLALLRVGYIVQPTVFLRRAVVERVGPLDISFRYAMDQDYWLRCTVETTLGYTPAPIATYRLHPDSKTVSSSLDLNIDTLWAVCKHLASGGRVKTTRRQRRSIMASNLLSLAMRAIRANDTDLAVRLVRGAWQLNVFDPRYLQLPVALADQRFGWSVEEKLADALFSLLNPSLKRGGTIGAPGGTPADRGQ
jgi:glycosyltransferase involved in cell wall biosynthesis